MYNGARIEISIGGTMSDENEDLSLGGGAPPLGPPGASLADEEKAIKGGKGGMIAGVAIGVLLVVGVAVFALSGDGTEAYRNFGRSVNGLDQEHFDGFWHCAFQGSEEVANNTELTSEIHQRAARGSKRYGQYVRSDCLPKLEALEPGIEGLVPPEDLQGDVRDLRAAVGELRGGWSDFIAHLDGLEGPYDESAAGSSVNRIAKGWFDYRTSHSKLNKALTEKLQ